MKKFFALILVLTLSLGGFAIHVFAESGEDGSVDIGSSQPDSSLSDDSSVSVSPPDDSSADISAPDDSSLPDDSSGGDISSPSSSGDDREECEVTITANDGGEYRVENKKPYYVGDTLVISLSPDDNMGVKTVTVNDEEFNDFSVGGGAISIELEGDTTVNIEFAETVRVIIDWSVGGTVTANGQKISDNKGFKVIKGSDLLVRITTNANQAINKVVNDGEDVTSEVKYGRYTIENIQSGCVITVSFRETGDTDVDTYTITVNIEGKGTVDPDGAIQVEHGEDLILTIKPAGGYVIQSVSDRGRTYKVSGSTYTVKNVYEDGTVTVTFADPNESSAAESSDDPIQGNENYITRADIEKISSESELRIDISSKTQIGKDALAYINELIAGGKSVSIGVSGSFWWILPSDAKFTTTSLADDGINFGVLVNTGDVSAQMKQLIQEKADKNQYNHMYNITIERLTATPLPTGTLLKVYMGEEFKPNQKLDWLKYDATNKKFTQMCDTEGALTTVDNSLYATVEMPFPEKYGMLVNYIDKNSTLTFTWNQKHCTMSVVGQISVSEDGISTNTVAWKSGKDVYITVNLKDGFAIKEISTDDFANMELLFGGKDVTNTAGKDISGSITIKISGISKDGHIIITTAEAEETPIKANSTVPWDVIVLIVIIVIAMVAGGAVFVIKWRQSDDDDDYIDED